MHVPCDHSAAECCRGLGAPKLPFIAYPQDWARRLILRTDCRVFSPHGGRMARDNGSESGDRRECRDTSLPGFQVSPIPSLFPQESGQGVEVGGMADPPTRPGRIVVTNRLFSYNPRLLGNRLAVGQRTLDPLAEVRILVPQPHSVQVPLNATNSTRTTRMPAEIPSRKLQPSTRICESQKHLPLPAHAAHRYTW